MELRHLRYFVAVAEELHFGRAAGRLHLAQPPLSRQIRQLEDELGVRLLDRTNRRVELTAAGRVFLDDARRLLAQADEAVAAARRAGRGETGRLAVGFIGSATYGVLPEILRVFHRAFPDVALSLHEMSSALQHQALAEGRIHIGFVRPAAPNVAILPGSPRHSRNRGGAGIPPAPATAGPKSRPSPSAKPITPSATATPDAALVGRVVRREALVAALPAGHRLARPPATSMPDLPALPEQAAGPASGSAGGTPAPQKSQRPPGKTPGKTPALPPLPLSELAAEPFILFPREPRPSFGDLVIGYCVQAGFSPRAVQETNEMQTAVSLVAAGIGVTLVPDAVRSLSRTGVVYRPLAEPVPMTEMTAVYRRDDASPVLRTFLTVVDEIIPRTAGKSGAGADVAGWSDTRRQARGLSAAPGRC